MADGGPHLQMAAFCENVLEDKEGVLSLVRVVDQVTQTATGPDAPDQMPPFILSHLTLVIMLKADQARGRYAVKIRPEDPSGIQLPPAELPIHLEGSNRGVNLLVPLQIPISLEGVYWFDVLFMPGRNEEDRLLSRVPLAILYRPQKSG
jgi:hypothetical protein